MIRQIVFDLACQDCGSDEVTVVAEVGKDGRVRFKVECDQHDGFSHMLPRTAIQHAVEEMLRTRPE
jgi:hypothetical protein